MAISVQCACGQKYNVKDELAGKKLKCKKCGEGMRVPAPKRKPPSDDEFGFDDPWSSGEPMQPPPARVRIKKQKVAAAKSSASSSGGTTLDERIAARGAEAANADRRSWKRPMIVLFWGIFYVAIGYFSYVGLTDFENDPERTTTRLPRVIALLYMIGGKWLVALGVGGYGVVNLVYFAMHVLGISELTEEE